MKKFSKIKMIPPKIKHFRLNDDYTITLNYEDGDRVFDVKPYLNTGVYKKLKDINFFKKARLSFNSIEWGNEEVDIDPEFLYEKSVK